MSTDEQREYRRLGGWPLAALVLCPPLGWYLVIRGDYRPQTKQLAVTLSAASIVGVWLLWPAGSGGDDAGSRPESRESRWVDEEVPRSASRKAAEAAAARAAQLRRQHLSRAQADARSNAGELSASLGRLELQVSRKDWGNARQLLDELSPRLEPLHPAARDGSDDPNAPSLVERYRKQRALIEAFEARVYAFLSEQTGQATPPEQLPPDERAAAEAATRNHFGITQDTLTAILQRKPRHRPATAK